MFPRLNKPYITFVAIVCTAGLAFIAWAITSQVYREWSRSLPISGGWNWPIVLSVDFLCLFLAVALYWKIYADSKTTIDGTGVGRPSLRGPKFIAWSDVTGIKVVVGGFHICAGKRKIAITPYAYSNPEQVIETLQRYGSVSRHAGAA